MPDSPAVDDPRRVHPLIDRLGAASWRLIGIGIVAWALLLLLGRLRVVVFPVIVAAMLTAVLSPLVRRLRARRWPPLLAAWVVFAGFLAVLVGAGFVIVPPVSDQFSELGPVVSSGIDDVETWLVEDAPIDITRERIAELRAEIGDRARATATRSGGALVKGAVLAFEIVAGLILALVTTFFLLKDGHRFQKWAVERLPSARRDDAQRYGSAAWRGLTGYLRGSAMLGAVEAVIMVVTLTVVGAGLAVPVAVLTFLAAFVPFVGAAVAGLVAVLVALVTAGGAAAAVVAIVAVIVQQLDNDVLAPIVFGKALHLHPLVILLSVAAGASLAGLVGGFLAVPTAAVIGTVIAEAANPSSRPQAAEAEAAPAE